MYRPKGYNSFCAVSVGLCKAVMAFLFSLVFLSAYDDLSLPPLSFTALKAWGEFSGWVTGRLQRTNMLMDFSPDFPIPWQIILSGLDGVTFKVLLWQWRRWRCMFRFCASGMMFSLYRITKAKRFCPQICARKRFAVALITLVVTLIIHFRFFTPAKRQDDNSPDETISVLEKTIIPRQIARRGTEKLSGVEPLAGNFCFTISISVTGPLSISTAL